MRVILVVEAQIKALITPLNMLMIIRLVKKKILFSMWFSGQKFEQIFCRQSNCIVYLVWAAKLQVGMLLLIQKNKGNNFRRASFSLTDSESGADMLETKTQ